MQWLIIIFFFITGCGNDSLTSCSNKKSPLKSKCVDQTDDEKSMSYLNEKKYSEAIALINPLVENFPEEYFRYPRLASAYAGLAGFDIFNIANAQNDSEDAGLGGISAFIPAPSSKDELDDYYITIGYMQDAKATLENMPEAERSSDANTFYSSSAQFQYVLYHSCYTVMCMNLINLLVGDGSNIDFDGIALYPNCDASKVIESLINAALAAATVNQSLEGDISDLKAQIEAAQGSNETQKLANYIASQNKSDAN